MAQQRRYIKHIVLPGGNFDGTAPTGEPAIEGKRHAIMRPQKGGGMFMPGDCTIHSIALEGGDVNACVFRVAWDGSHEDVLLSRSGPRRQTVWNGELELKGQDKILVTTKGGRREMACTVVYSQ